MGKITGFLEIERHDRKYAPVAERVKHYHEFVVPLSEKDTRDQAARCMNCGIPYCHGTGSVAPGTPGCPVNNQIPDWNDLVYNDRWQEASHGAGQMRPVNSGKLLVECRLRAASSQFS